jgi:hypothetical protein
MLCTTCLGVLEECRNLILDKPAYFEIPETTAGKSIFRQGTIDTTAPESGHDGHALLENATSHHLDVKDEGYHVGTTSHFRATSSDEGELAQHYTSDSQPVSAVQSERSDDASDFGRHAIYGHHATLADLKTAASSGCQICWHVWDLLSLDKFNIAAGLSEAPGAVESAKIHFCTCLLVNIVGRRSSVDIYYDGTESPQNVCMFTLFSETSMYGPSPNCYNR